MYVLRDARKTPKLLSLTSQDIWNCSLCTCTHSVIPCRPWNRMAGQHI